MTRRRQLMNLVSLQHLVRSQANWQSVRGGKNTIRLIFLFSVLMEQLLFWLAQEQGHTDSFCVGEWVIGVKYSFYNKCTMKYI